MMKYKQTVELAERGNAPSTCFTLISFLVCVSMCNSIISFSIALCDLYLVLPILIYIRRASYKQSSCPRACFLIALYHDNSHQIRFALSVDDAMEEVGVSRPSCERRLFVFQTNHSQIRSIEISERRLSFSDAMISTMND